MKDDDLKQFCREFRHELLQGGSSRGACAMVCVPLAGLLEFMGITKCEVIESDLSQFENGWMMNHVWLQLPDGRVLDPTADQFNGPGMGHDGLPDIYLGPPLDFHLMEGVHA